MQEREIEIEIERVGTFFYSLAMLATTCIDFYQYFFTIDASTNESLFLQVTQVIHVILKCKIRRSKFKKIIIFVHVMYFDTFNFQLESTVVST
jgi:hypothetical protein